MPEVKRSPVDASYGEWAVIREVTEPGCRRRILCRCSCGTERIVNLASLRLARSTSCGHANVERIAALNRSHGLADRVPEYGIWLGMRRRCTRRDKHYEDVSVCDRWQLFENFYQDMGPRPSPAHSIDRKDGSKGYEPGNCRWATPLQQAQNRKKRKPAKLSDREVAEIRLSVEPSRALSERYGVHQQTIRSIRNGTHRRAG